MYLQILSLICAALQKSHLPHLLKGHISLCAEWVMVPALSKRVEVIVETGEKHKVHKEDMQCV